MEIRWTDKLAKYTIYLAVAAIVLAILWYFRNVIFYILLAGVFSIIGSPLSEKIKKIEIKTHKKTHKCPGWLASICTLVIISGIFAGVVSFIVPMIGKVVRDISTLNLDMEAIAVPLEKINNFIANTLPILGSDFHVETVVTEEVQKFLNASEISSMISTTASFLTNMAIALVSTIFISFFFFKDENLFAKMISALVPKESETAVKNAVLDIQGPLTKYFIGLLVETIGVALINFLGLSLIARLGVVTALSIAVITGILNIIPYVGPIIGGVIGTIMALLWKYSSVGFGIDAGFWGFVVIVVTILCVTQVIDNYVFKNNIYSDAIDAHPLEIFVVTIMAGTLGGIVGMLIAIPCYTVFRVVAGRFFRGKFRFVDQLLSYNSKKSKSQDDGKIKLFFDKQNQKLKNLFNKKPADAEKQS